MHDEIRTYPLGELRLLEEDGQPRIMGRAVVYNALSEDLGGFRERFLPGAVKFTEDMVALFDHDTSKVLGRASAGTLSVTDGPAGVDMVALPPDTTWARDLRVSMERGDIKHMSFRFRPLEQDWQMEGDTPIRTVTAAEVSEVSVVSMPAYAQTSVEARSMAAELRTGSAAPTIDIEDNAEAGGSPVEASTEGGSPDPTRTYLIAGKVVTFPEKG